MRKQRPLYQKVREELTNSLAAGEWLPGAMIPSESKLAERFKVGISTVRAALRELEGAHVLVRAQGRGTFVARFDQHEGVHRFFNIERKDGAERSPSRQMLGFERVQAPAHIAELLELPRTGGGDKIYKLTTLVRLDGVPTYYSNVFLPVLHFHGLKRSSLPDGSRSLYSLYQQLFNINVTKVIDTVSTANAPAQIAKLCNVETGASMLCLSRVSYNYDGVPIDVRHGWVNTNGHCYRIEQGASA